MQNQESSHVNKPRRGGCGCHGGQHSGSQPIGYQHLHEHAKDECGLPCGGVLQSRNHYFTGKYMTARDFQDEQDYFVSHHRLHNRLLHGWGIVCGLIVSPHSERCPNYVVVSAGIAIDCCGREIVLEQATAVRIWKTEDEAAADAEEQAAADAEEKAAADTQEAETIEVEAVETAEIDAGAVDQKTAQLQVDRTAQRTSAYPGRKPFPKPGSKRQPTVMADPGPYLLVIRYDEDPIEQVPALYSEEDCDPHRMEANRVLEGAWLEAIPWDADARKRFAGCWPDPERKVVHDCRTDCTGQAAQDQEGCLEPVCECDLGVGLALIVPEQTSTGYAVTREAIHIEGRRDLQTPPEYLTHIVKVNWTHGGDVPLSFLRQEMKGQLRVTFDRKLMPAGQDSLATGINPMTFMVQYHKAADVQYPLAMLFNDNEPAVLDAEKCEAVFTIERELLEGRQTLGDCILLVTLKCDFILDCLGRLVDGEHIKGQLPSGDGRPGGTFESWFRVIDDVGPKYRRGKSAE
jgi:hypothetical protein